MVKEYTGLVKSVLSECNRCGKLVSDVRMTKHRKHFKFENAPAPVVTTEPADDVPQGFAKGG